MPGLVLDHLSLGGWLLFELLAFPVFAVSVLWSLVHLLMQLDRDAWGPVGDWRRAAPALGLNAIALAVFLLPPCAQTVDHLDFWLHYSTRSTIVQAVQAGVVQPLPLAGSGATVVSLQEHPWSVSRWGEEKRPAVYRDGERCRSSSCCPCAAEAAATSPSSTVPTAARQCACFPA